MPVAFPAIQRVLGFLLMIFSVTMLLPIIVSLIFADGTWGAFAASFVIILGSGVVIWLPVRNEDRELRRRDGFLVVALFWVVLGLFGMKMPPKALEQRHGYKQAMRGPY